MSGRLWLARACCFGPPDARCIVRRRERIIVVINTVLLLFIYSLTFIELTPIFLPLLKMTEVSRNVYIIFLQFFLQIVTSLLLALVIAILSILIFPPYFAILLYLRNDFLALNFRKLLHLLGNGLKNIIRNSEKKANYICSIWHTF